VALSQIFPMSSFKWMHYLPKTTKKYRKHFLAVFGSNNKWGTLCQTKYSSATHSRLRVQVRNMVSLTLMVRVKIRDTVRVKK